ncbi:MAG: hypothetical protein E7244_18380 [Enterocloster citroniae]|nr:hypothetical protein [Enterocloster citroniae]
MKNFAKPLPWERRRRKKKPWNSVKSGIKRRAVIYWEPQH